jgi:hypothetical protein
LGAGELSLIAAVLVAVLLAVAGVAAFLFVAMGVIWFLRRGSAPAPEPKKKKGKVDADASTVIRDPKATPAKESKATPAPLTPASAVRGDAGKGAAPVSPLAGPPGFLAPPPPPPFKGAGGSPGKGADDKVGDGKAKGPLLGFFDEEKPQGEEQKTELFSRDMAARYAAMLDDEDDEGEHTELFSAANLDAEMAAALLDEDPSTAGKLPGKVVASNKK